MKHLFPALLLTAVLAACSGDKGILDFLFLHLNRTTTL
jgi:hypothetical protein